MKRLLLVLLAFVAFGCLDAPRYKGPAVAGFDGKRFENLAPYRQKDFADFLEWKLQSSAVSWPDFVHRPEGPRPPARVDAGLRIQMVNHATVLIQTAGLNIITDPIWSERP